MSASTSRAGIPSRLKGPRSRTRSKPASFKWDQSTKKPWNFYYWPTKADAIHEPWAGGNARVDTMNVNGDDQLIASPGGYIPPGVDIVMAGPNGLLETLPAAGDDATWFPNLYDDLEWLGPDKEHGGQVTRFQTPSPLLKYDQLFGTSARQWEAAFSQNKDISRWPGHCLGGAVASILLNEPSPAPGSGLTKDELKALWAELGENHYNHRIGDYANEIPPGPPRPGYDATDWKAPRVHAMLETHIRGERKPLLGQPAGLPSARHDQRGLEPRRLQVHRDLQGDPQPRPARREYLQSSCMRIRARCSTARMTRIASSSTNTTWFTASTARSTRPTPWPPTGSRWEARLSLLHSTFSSWWNRAGAATTSK